MCQRKTEFCTQILIYSKPSSIHVQPKKCFYGYKAIVYVHCAICQKYIYKMSICNDLI